MENNIKYTTKIQNKLDLSEYYNRYFERIFIGLVPISIEDSYFIDAPKLVFLKTLGVVDKPDARYEDYRDLLKTITYERDLLGDADENDNDAKLRHLLSFVIPGFFATMYLHQNGLLDDNMALFDEVEKSAKEARNLYAKISGSRYNVSLDEFIQLMIDQLDYFVNPNNEAR